MKLVHGTGDIYVMHLVKNRVRYQICNQAVNQIYRQVDYRVQDQVDYVIYNQFYVQIRNKLDGIKGHIVSRRDA